MTRSVDIDDLNEIARLDSEDVLGAVERFADQCREGWEIGRGAQDLPAAEGVDSVVVLGMGGSGVSGDVIQGVVEPRLPVPYRTIKSYGPLPEWIGRNTLVFAVSYSGSTEETLAAMEEAHERGSRLIGLSSGGELADAARRYGFAHLAIPPGLQPRASLGYVALPILGALARVGLVPDMQNDVDDAVAVLADLCERCHRKIESDANPAKKLARRMEGKVPVIWGGYPTSAIAAYRFKCDVNEYAKAPAFWHEIPELDHNEILGYGNLPDVVKERFLLVLLREPNEHERVSLRFDITRELIGDRFSDVVEVGAEGDSALAHLLSLILVTQLAAIYLGLAYGEDPGPVPLIKKLKDELANR